jgi:CHAT domain-containing protein
MSGAGSPVPAPGSGRRLAVREDARAGSVSWMASGACRGAPDTLPLPGVTAETMAVRQFLPDALVLADPTRDTVLAALPGHQVAHFACHGHADWNDPASSRLILRDHHTAPVTVADVRALRLNLIWRTSPPAISLSLVPVSLTKPSISPALFTSPATSTSSAHSGPSAT